MDTKNIAYCGLYCEECKKFTSGKCPGCHENEKATWCGIRSCCIDNNYSSCADCTEYQDPETCSKFNNFMSKIFAFIFRSNRPACIQYIKENGYEAYAEHMTETGQMTLKR